MEKLMLTDFLKSINTEKNNLLRGADSATVKSYPSFVVARSLSYHQALIPLLDTLNECSKATPLQHYEFLLYTIPVAKRFAKWSKPSLSEDREFVARTYGVSENIAEEYIKILSEEQIEKIRRSFDEGGQVRGKSSE